MAESVLGTSSESMAANPDCCDMHTHLGVDGVGHLKNLLIVRLGEVAAARDEVEARAGVVLVVDVLDQVIQALHLMGKYWVDVGMGTEPLLTWSGGKLAELCERGRSRM